MSLLALASLLLDHPMQKRFASDPLFQATLLLLQEKYQDRGLADHVFDLAWTHAQVVLRPINATDAEAQLTGRLANSILYAHAALRADRGVLMRNRRGQSGLWGYAISGDLPIVLVRIGDLANIELVRQLIQAHAYWRVKGLAVDLVIWNEDRAGYRQVLQDQILGLVAVGQETQAMDRPGGIFVRSVEQISEEDRTLFQTVVRVILSDSGGTLAEQVNRPDLPRVRVPRLKPSRPRQAEVPAAFEAPRRALRAQPVQHRVSRPGRLLRRGRADGMARARRPVHPRRRLGGDGVRGPGGQPARLGAHHPVQPGQPREIRRGHRDLQCGVLCHGGRCLRGRAPHRTRRLDLVHRLGRLDVPAHPGIPAGPEAGSGQTGYSTLPAGALERVR